MFNLLKYHVETLFLMLFRFRQFQISLNFKKCIFCAPFGIQLGHLVNKQGLLVDLANIFRYSLFFTTYFSETNTIKVRSYEVLHEVY
jgi:hypothetical protein